MKRYVSEAIMIVGLIVCTVTHAVLTFWLLMKG